MRSGDYKYVPKHLAKDTHPQMPSAHIATGLSALAVTAGLTFALTTLTGATVALAQETDQTTPATTEVTATTTSQAQQESQPTATSTQSGTSDESSTHANAQVSGETSGSTQGSSQSTSTNSESTSQDSSQEKDSANAGTTADQAKGEERASESSASVHYQAHVQDKGWQEEVSTSTSQDGAATAGTTGQSKRVEAVRVSIVDGDGNKLENAVEYKAHVANQGWDKTWTRDGETVGTTGMSRAIEALKIRLIDQYAQLYDIFYRVHIQDHGWLDWTCNGDAAGSVGMSKRIEALQILLRLKNASDSPTTGEGAFLDNSGISIASHVQNVGWQGAATSNGQTSGTTGKGERIEAITARIGSGYDIDGGIQYRTYIQNSGWGSWVANGAVSGTTGKGLRVEAVQFELQGDIAKSYDLYYRVHVANYDWLDWVLAGTGQDSIAGTTGLSKRIEAIQLYMYKKEAQQKPKKGIGYVSSAGVSYAGQESNGTWTAAANGGVAGSTGKGIPLVAMRAALASGSDGLTGDISYQVHLANVGWVASQSDGANAGRSQAANNIQSIRISLGGTLGRFFDVYYRVHTHNIGWMGWTRDGSSAGTTGLGLPAEAFEITLVPKGNAAPGSTAMSFVDQNSYYGQIVATMNGAQARVRNSAFRTPSTPGGYCALWVTNVVSNAGYGYYSGNACDLYRSYCHSSDLKQLKIGMIIAVSSHPHTRAGSIYGHVGIYIGNGLMRDSVYGYVRQISVKDWMAYYGATVQPRWGWMGNRRLA